MKFISTAKLIIKLFAHNVKLEKNTYQIVINKDINDLRNSKRYDDPKKLTRFGYKIYSQCDEDGIIHEIFNRIGVSSKTFVEFGVGDGLENNTLALLHEGFTGLWIEASSRAVRKIINGYSSYYQDGRLKVVNKYITTKNIDEIISSAINLTEIDLLSVDIDGNEIYIVSSIKCIKPRVIVIEYNSKFPPPIKYCMNYDDNFMWKGDDCLGASLKHLEVELNTLGYKLVGCSLSGVNAFFIRDDLCKDGFSQPFSAENHYEPPRFYLTELSSGYPSSYQTLEKSIGNQPIEKNT